MLDEQDKQMVLALPNTVGGEYDSDDDEYDDEVLDLNNEQLELISKKNELSE